MCQWWWCEPTWLRPLLCNTQGFYGLKLFRTVRSFGIIWHHLAPFGDLPDDFNLAFELGGCYPIRSWFDSCDAHFRPPMDRSGPVLRLGQLVFFPTVCFDSSCPPPGRSYVSKSSRRSRMFSGNGWATCRQRRATWVQDVAIAPPWLISNQKNPKRHLFCGINDPCCNFGHVFVERTLPF